MTKPTKVKRKAKSNFKRNDNGTYTISSPADAAKALALAHNLKSEIEAIEKREGLPEMRTDAAAAMQSLVAWAVKKKVKRVELETGVYAVLVEGGYDRRWIATDAELEEMEAPADAVSIKSVLDKKYNHMPKRLKKVWRRIRRVTIDAKALEEVVAEGYLTEDEIAEAFVEKPKAPYMRIYEPKGD